jgi:hypothetical protein
LRQRRIPPQRGRETFFNKFVDQKTETAINTAPQVQGPSETVFVKVAASKEICKKLLTVPKT